MFVVPIRRALSDRLSCNIACHLICGTCVIVRQAMVYRTFHRSININPIVPLQQ